tara:strand:- start:346 stop:651 length:306 start_codon:yes stop_codon:yes gene_type:complete
MIQKKLINLFDEFELTSIKDNFTNCHTHYVNQSFNLQQETGDKWIDIIFNVQGRNSRDAFTLNYLTIIDLKVWLNDSETAFVTANSLQRIESILKTKINEL